MEGGVGGAARGGGGLMVGIAKTNGHYRLDNRPAWRHAWGLGQYLVRYSDRTCYRFSTRYFILYGVNYLKANKQKIRHKIPDGKILVPTPLNIQISGSAYGSRSHYYHPRKTATVFALIELYFINIARALLVIML